MLSEGRPFVMLVITFAWPVSLVPILIDGQPAGKHVHAYMRLTSRECLSLQNHKQLRLQLLQAITASILRLHETLLVCMC